MFKHTNKTAIIAVLTVTVGLTVSAAAKAGEATERLTSLPQIKSLLNGCPGKSSINDEINCYLEVTHKSIKLIPHSKLKERVSVELYEEIVEAGMKMCDFGRDVLTEADRDQCRLNASYQFARDLVKNLSN